MSRTIAQSAEIMAKAYNQRLSDVFDELSESYDPSYLDRPEFAEELQRESLNALASWFDKTLEGLEGQSPAEFVDSLKSREALLEVFDCMAVHCDVLLPEYFQIRLGHSAGDVLPALRERALALPLDISEARGEADAEKMMVQLAAMELLGQWQDLVFLEDLLRRIQSSQLMNETLATGVKRFFVQFGEKTLPALVNYLNLDLDKDAPNPNCSYLLIYITELGHSAPLEEAYQVLRKAFKRLDEKIIPVICLGDYGDGRAVPLLRSYLEKNWAELDRGMQSELMSSIKRLGGNVEG